MCCLHLPFQLLEDIKPAGGSSFRCPMLDWRNDGCLMGQAIMTFPGIHGVVCAGSLFLVHDVGTQDVFHCSFVATHVLSAAALFFG